MKLPVDQPSAVAFTAFADAWPRTTEKEIDGALCAIGAGRTLTCYILITVLCLCIYNARTRLHCCLFVSYFMT